MNREQGLKQIDDAEWYLCEHGTLNLYVRDAEGRGVHSWLSLRPSYCDRGHIQLNIEGPLSLDEADSFPRFFFSAAEAKRHTKDFLKWRLWKYSFMSTQDRLDFAVWGQNPCKRVAEPLKGIYPEA